MLCYLRVRRCWRIKKTKTLSTEYCRYPVFGQTKLKTKKNAVLYWPSTENINTVLTVRKPDIGVFCTELQKHVIVLDIGAITNSKFTNPVNIVRINKFIYYFC